MGNHNHSRASVEHSQMYGFRGDGLATLLIVHLFYAEGILGESQADTAPML
jgi:hypothetical protein